jgi:hypothetical protein
MNPYAIPSLVAIIVLTCLGVYVPYKNPKSSLNRIFALLMFVCAIWALGEFGGRIALEPEGALMWIRAMYLGGAFVGPTFLHFTLAFTEKGILQRKLTYPIIYGLGFVFLYLALATNLFIEGVEPAYYGFTRLFGPAFYGHSAYLIGCLVTGTILLCHAYLKATEPLEKKHKLYVMLWVLVPVICGLPTSVILPAFLDIKVVELGTILTAGVGVFVAYAVLRYKLFVIPPISKFFIPTPRRTCAPK